MDGCRTGGTLRRMNDEDFNQKDLEAALLGDCPISPQARGRVFQSLKASFGDALPSPAARLHSSFRYQFRVGRLTLGLWIQVHRTSPVSESKPESKPRSFLKFLHLS